MRPEESDALRVRLAAATEAGETIRIIYHGGSQPGSVREVRPLAVLATALRARDVAAGIDKHFLLAKIEIADTQVTAPVHDPAVTRRSDDDRTIQELLAPRVPELQALGFREFAAKRCSTSVGLLLFFVPCRWGAPGWAIVGPLSRPNVGDMVSIPALVAPSDIMIFPDGAKALVVDRSRLVVLDFATKGARIAVEGLAYPNRAAVDENGPTAFTVQSGPNAFQGVGRTTGGPQQPPR